MLPPLEKREDTAIALLSKIKVNSKSLFSFLLWCSIHIERVLLNRANEEYHSSQVFLALSINMWSIEYNIWYYTNKQSHSNRRRDNSQNRQLYWNVSTMHLNQLRIYMEYQSFLKKKRHLVKTQKLSPFKITDNTKSVFGDGEPHFYFYVLTNPFSK